MKRNNHTLPKYIRLGVLTKAQQDLLRSALHLHIAADHIAWRHSLRIQIPVTAELPIATYDTEVILATAPRSRWAVYATPRAALLVLALSEHKDKPPIKAIINALQRGIVFDTMRVLYDVD